MIDRTPISLDRPDGSPKTMAEIESEVIIATVNACSSRTRAADVLAIGRSTLYRKLAEFNHPSNDGSNDVD
jgi:DNA-binding NtrC family response regulator